MFFIVGNLLGTFALCITEPHILASSDRGFLQLLFEQVSALGTVGLEHRYYRRYQHSRSRHSDREHDHWAGWNPDRRLCFFPFSRQQELQIPRRPHDGRIRASLHHQMGTPIKPYEDEAAKKAQVARMFDNIAHRYDFLNHFFSLGIDKLWRRKAIRMLLAEDPHEVLDVATGTADFAIGTATGMPTSRWSG